MSSGRWLAIGLLTCLSAMPALGCTTCGCGLPGSGADIGSIAGAGAMFGGMESWLLQTGVSIRDITGSFNETGAWVDKPVGSTLRSLQIQTALTWYPRQGLAFSMTLPGALNRLEGARWAALGKVAPLDVSDEETGEAIARDSQGGGLADIALQGSWTVRDGEGPWPAVAIWGGLTLPTGRAAGTAADMTGLGLPAGQAGVAMLWSDVNWSQSLNLAWQQPLTPLAAGPIPVFYLGRALLGTWQGEVELIPDGWLGLGITAFRAESDVPGLAESARLQAKVKVTPSVEWRLAEGEGIRLAVGLDPDLGLSRNAMTDRTIGTIYYRRI
ncbi:MAG: hypothetical protein FJY99_04055 [Candidatus Sericytochromatia bacterium]|nr:hypothetical protein [Candidatus Tanganyikabacteria bacterium]